MTRVVPRIDFLRALKKMGVGDYKVIAIISDLAAFGDLEHSGGTQDAMLQSYLDCFQELVGPDGTLVVPTFTYVRRGPDSPYIHETTPSETGTLTEFIRRKEDSLRSCHPIFSFAAIGKEKDRICSNVTRNSYGMNTPAYRLLECDALVVSIGRSPHRGSFFIHLGEVFTGVPYRYVKELSIPVFAQGRQVNEAFYHYAKYLDSDIVWDTNRLIERLESQRMVHYEPLGMSGVWVYRARDIVEATIKLLLKNIYGLLAHPPTQAPWKK